MASTPLPDDVERPPVVTWYRVYAGLMAAIYVLTFIGGVVIMVFHRQIGQGNDPPPMVALLYGGFIAVLGAIFTVPFAAALFVPRKPWTWVYHIVLICVGLSSPCCMMASVPLLIYWLKPETRAYFGRGPS